MKPCANQRKPIALLALGDLEARQARALRAHLETCAGCRAYSEEMSNVTRKLAASGVGSELRVSETFHRQLAARLRAHERRPVGESLLVTLRALCSNSRMALPLLGLGAALIVTAMVLLPRPTPLPLPVPAPSQAVAPPPEKRDLAPTISNYQMVANRSLEKLDELLSRQANKNLSPIPIYTASALSRANGLD